MPPCADERGRRVEPASVRPGASSNRRRRRRRRHRQLRASGGHAVGGGRGYPFLRPSSPRETAKSGST
jgi:hypothetical protein